MRWREFPTNERMTIVSRWWGAMKDVREIALPKNPKVWTEILEAMDSASLELLSDLSDTKPAKPWTSFPMKVRAFVVDQFRAMPGGGPAIQAACFYLLNFDS